MEDKLKKALILLKEATCHYCHDTHIIKRPDGLFVSCLWCIKRSNLLAEAESSEGKKNKPGDVKRLVRNLREDAEKKQRCEHKNIEQGAYPDKPCHCTDCGEDI